MKIKPEVQRKINEALALLSEAQIRLDQVKKEILAIEENLEKE